MYRPLRVLIIIAVSLVTGTALAHWCSNIFSGPSRLVIKPEQTQISMSSGSAIFRVHLQNNFPYKLFGVLMDADITPAAGHNESEYSVEVSPVGQDVHPGQNVGFLYTVTGPTGNATLTLRVKIRNGLYNVDANDVMADQTPTFSRLVNGTESDYYASPGEQSPSLNAFALALANPTYALKSDPPFFSRTARQQLIHWFGYRFCYDTGGSWACYPESDQCPSTNCTDPSVWSSLEQFPQDCMRAGIEVAVLHARGLLGGDLTMAKNGAKHALENCTATNCQKHECLAAVVGAYLYRNESAAEKTNFKATLEAAANGIHQDCINAAKKILGETVSQNCTVITNSEYHRKAACAAAEGLTGNNTPVTSILMAQAGDGSQSNPYQLSLFHAYMLRLVTEDRRGAALNGVISYYPDAGSLSTVPMGDTRPWPDTQPWPDAPPPQPDTQPWPDAPPPQPDTQPWPDGQLPQLDVTPNQDSLNPQGDLRPRSDGLSVQADGTGPLKDGASNIKNEVGTVVKENRLEGGCGCEMADPGSSCWFLILISISVLALGFTSRKKTFKKRF